MKRIVCTTFLWVSMTPRGSAVLPEVYWRNARSSGPAGSTRGSGAPTSRSTGSRIERTLGALATLASTPARNQPIVATATEPELLKTLAVASTPSVG